MLMQTPDEALAEAREEILALLEENRHLREEIERMRRVERPAESRDQAGKERTR